MMGESLPAHSQIRSLSNNYAEIMASLFRYIFDFHKLALDYFRKPGPKPQESGILSKFTNDLKPGANYFRRRGAD